MPAAPTPPIVRRLAALLLAGNLLAGCGGAQGSAERDGQGDAPGESQPPLAGAAIGGPFELVDAAGASVRWSDFAGRYRIVYFGYTFCPDVCPLDLQRMMQGYHAFAREHPERAARLQPLFITIDPARDTPAVMGEFTANFGEELVGLTGTQAQVDTAAKAFAVYHAKGGQSAGGGYLMDHSRTAYLMDPAGEPLALLPVESGGQAVAAELARWVK